MKLMVPDNRSKIDTMEFTDPRWSRIWSITTHGIHITLYNRKDDLENFDLRRNYYIAL